MRRRVRKVSKVRGHGGSIDDPRNIGINWRKIKARENGRRRGKGACCLIFNRIIFFPAVLLFI